MTGIMMQSSLDLNRAALDDFVRQPVRSYMIQHLVKQASLVIRCEDTTPIPTPTSAQLPLTPPSTPPPDCSAPTLPPLELFIRSIVAKSSVQVPTLMTSLVYLARLQARLPPVAKGMRCTVHRIFLASLILAAKNLNDSSPKNKHWARYTTVKGYDGFGFALAEVNLMERQLLFLLDWDTRVTELDLLNHFEPFLAPIRFQMQLDMEAKHMHEQQRQWHAEAAMIQDRVQRLPSHIQATRNVSMPARLGLYNSPCVMTNEDEHRPSRVTLSSSAAKRRAPSLGRPAYRSCNSTRDAAVDDLPELPPLIHSNRHNLSNPSSAAHSRSSSLAPSSRSSSVAPSQRSIATPPQTLCAYPDENVTFAIADAHYSPDHAYSQAQAQHYQYQQTGYYYGKARPVTGNTTSTNLAANNRGRPGLKGHQISFSQDGSDRKKVKAEHGPGNSLSNIGNIGNMMGRLFNRSTTVAA